MVPALSFANGNWSMESMLEFDYNEKVKILFSHIFFLYGKENMNKYYFKKIRCPHLLPLNRYYWRMELFQRALRPSFVYDWHQSSECLAAMAVAA